MKKRFILCSLLLVLFFIISAHILPILEYHESIQSFIPITAESIQDMLLNESDDSFFLYTGRKSCPWCLKFVPVLSRVAQTHNLCIYYLDSTDTESNKYLKKFRQIYGIEHVPSLIYFSKKGSTEIKLNITDHNFSEDTLFSLMVAAKAD